METAQCECPRGRVICHHIAATMFAAHYEISSTDGSCTWIKKKPSKDDEVKTCKQILNLPFHPRLTQRDLTDNEIGTMLEKLKEIGPVGFSWLLKNEETDDCSVVNNKDDACKAPNVQTIISSKEFESTTNKIDFLRAKLKLGIDDIKNIAEKTIGQHTNPAWFITRKFRITASNFSRVLKSISRNRYPPSLYNTLIGN